MAKRIILDEFSEVNRILEEGFSRGKINKYDLSLLAKYYRSLGYGFAKIKSSLIDFCTQQDDCFSPVAYREMINEAIAGAKKYRLKSPEAHVMITWNEIAKLKEVDRVYAQILFVMLVIAKHEKFNSTKIERKTPENFGYYCRHSFEDILRLAKVHVSKKEINGIKYKLDGEGGYISASLMSEKSWKINFADDNSEPFMFIDCLDDIPSKLPYFCEKCGAVIEKKSKHHEFCSECYKTYRKEIKRISESKRRQKNKSVDSLKHFS